MTLDRKYVLCAFAYAIAGMCVGVYMGVSGNHGELVAHAHIMLVGFVVSLIYGLVHKVWLPGLRRTLAQVQFYLHQGAAFVMLCALLLLYGGALPESTLGPILGLSSLGVLIAAVLMAYIFAVSPAQAPAAASTDRLQTESVL